jgi:hypothetical protein
MQVTIEIEPQTLALLQEAEKRGITLDELLCEALRRVDEQKHFQERASAEEWTQSLVSWANNRQSLPAIPGEALRREYLYEDRI